jgi:hypothetical protein
MKSDTNRFKRIETDVLFCHLKSLQGQLRHPDAVGKRNLPFTPVVRKYCISTP